MTTDVRMREASTPTAPPADYPLWHGSTPPAAFLRTKIREDKFLVEGDGIRVRDAAGRWYVDARSSCWNLGLGYSAQPVKDAIREQLDALANATLLAYDRPAEVTVRYARALRDAVGPATPYVRLGNTGTQMTESAIMVSRFVRQVEGDAERTLVLSLEGSYHGLGPGGNALSGFVRPFDFCGPLMPGVHLVPAEGSWARNLERTLDELGAERVTALIVEPQMGSRGIVPEPDDLREVAELCRRAGIHFIADEVTTGGGRTGAMARTVQLGIEPDMVVLGKNLTSGYVPIAALLVSEAIYAAAAEPDPPRFLPAGSATDGHPVAAAAGLAVLDVFEREGTLDQVQRVGAELQARLAEVHRRRIGAGAVAGAGFMQLFPLLHADGRPWTGPILERFRLACEANGVLLSLGAACAWVVPPFVTRPADCEEIAAAIDAALETVLDEEEA